jgi:hypothetical protein
MRPRSIGIRIDVLDPRDRKGKPFVEKAYSH